MKKGLLLFLFVVVMFAANAQSATIQVNGSNIVGVCNDNIILRGINYAPFNWGWDLTDDKFSEIAKTGANCVRMVWYSTSAAGGVAPAYGNIANLDTAIAQCIRNKMIPIIELHDITCNGDISQIATLSNWYLSTGVKAIINKYAHNLIINVANEAGYVAWASNPTTALASFKSTYESVVSNFRSAGINVPVMIDAPDCGTNLTALASIGAAMETADPQHNLIFSAHAYWYAYANNDSATMRGILTNALAQGVPIVLGEVANLQDDANPCEYTLNYKPLLNICQQMNVSWLAWSWDHDVCSARQISSAGYYASLTTYGNDIVNNAGYGLQSHAVLTGYLANNQSCSAAVTSGQTALWSMTSKGGANGYGCIFKINPDGSGYTRVYNFDFGNGASPSGSLLQASNGILYGMASGGGSSRAGVIFSFDPSTNTYSDLFNFHGTYGTSPLGGLMQASNGLLYGMTQGGGAIGFGVIFSFNPSGNIYTKLFDLNNNIGEYPTGSLMQASNGLLYGMTQHGGANDLQGNMGEIFSFNLSTNAFTELFIFDQVNGGLPTGNLIQGLDGRLYGMADWYSPGGGGLIFSYDPSSNTLVDQYDFYPGWGIIPQGSLIQAPNGIFYGMASQGGAYDLGTIFSFYSVQDSLADIYDFSNFNYNTANPSGSLLLASNGLLYGMTNAGGSNGQGDVFSLNLSSDSLTELRNLAAPDGTYPVYSSFIEVGTNIATTTPVTLTTGSLYTSLCPNNSITVPYTASVTYNADNYFTAQLSNASGTFIAPVDIGAIAATASGTINAIIPANISAGRDYRIRVVSSDPVTAGSDDGINISINSKPIASLNGGGVVPICAGAALSGVSVALSGTAPWNLTYAIDGVNQTTLTGITENPYLIPGATQGTYIITGLSDANCIATAFDGNAIVEVNPMPTINTVANQTICSGNPTTAVNFTGAIPFTVYKWANTDTSIGLAASGTGYIPPFTTKNSGNASRTAVITATPYYTSAIAYMPGFIRDLGQYTLDGYDLNTNTRVFRYITGYLPLSIAISLDGSKIYYTDNTTGNFSVLSTVTNNLIATVPLGGYLQTIVLSPDGSKAYVTNLGTATLSIINTATYKVIAGVRLTNGVTGAAISPDGTKLYATSPYSGLYVYNTTTYALITTISLSGELGGDAVSPDGSKVYVTDNEGNNNNSRIYVINTATNTVTDTVFGVGQLPESLIISPDGSRAYVSNPYQNEDHYVPVINTVTDSVIFKIPTLSSPVGLQLSPDGSILYVNDNTGSISSFNATTGAAEGLTGSHGTGIFGTFISSNNTNCSGTPITFSIMVNPSPTDTVASNSPVCAGSILNLSSTSAGATGYSWTGPNGFTSTQQNPGITNFNAVNVGVYIDTVIAANGCTATASVMAALITATASSNSPVCVGSTINLTSTPGASYAWTGPNGFTSAIQNPVLSNASLVMAGTYSVTVTNASNCSVTTTTNVIVSIPPIVTTSPSSQSTTVGGDVSFNANVAGGGVLTYQWKKGTVNVTNSTRISGATSGTLTINPVAATDAASPYNCVVSSGGCTVASKNDTLNIATAPPAITGQTAQPAPTCDGSNISMIVTVTGGAISCQWYKGTTPLVNGGDIIGATSTMLKINPVSLHDSGTYYSILTNLLGTISSGSVTLTVLAKPVITAQPQATQLACLGNTASLSVAATGAGLTYQWKKGGTVLSDGTTSSGSVISGSLTSVLTISGITAADAYAGYYCIVKGTCATVNSAYGAIVVGVPASPTVITPQTGGTVVAPGDIYTYSIRKVLNATSYSWTDHQGGGTITEVNGAGPTDTLISITYNNVILVKDTISVTANDGCGSSVAAILTLTPNSPKNPGVITAQTGGTKVCPGDVYTYSIRKVSNAKTYTWADRGGYGTITELNGSGLNDTIIRVTYNIVIPLRDTISVTANNTCGSSAYSNLVIVPNTVVKPGAITAQTGGTKVCPDDVYTYSIRKVANAVSYNWLVNQGSGSISHNNGTGVNDTLITVTYNSLIASRDTVSVASYNGCGTSAATDVLITPNTPVKPVAIACATAALKVCPGDVYTYSIRKIANATGYSWRVNQGSGSITHNNGTGVFDTLITVTYNTVIALKDTISVTANNGCGSTAPTYIYITPNTPVRPGAITAQTGGTTVCPGNVYTYSIRKVTNALSYSWNVNQGSGSITHNNGSGVYDTLITVTYTSLIPLKDTISVIANNGCGSTLPTNLAIAPNSPVKPPSITAQTGGTKVCPGDVYTYSIRKIANASGYTWKVNQGSGTISHTNGSGLSDTLITVTYTSIIAVRDTISVTANNGCGSSAAAILVILPNAAGEPGIISGSIYGVRNTTQTYSVTPLNNISYSWNWSILPSPVGSATINSATGMGNDSVTVTFNSAFCTGTLGLVAINNCNNHSVARTLAIHGSPEAPVISGPAAVCPSDTNGYSIVPLADATLGYVWLVPTGSTIINGQGTDTITVSFGTSGGNVVVYGKNSCGNGALSFIAVNLNNNCRQMLQQIETGAMALYPNPTTGMITYSFMSTSETTGNIQLMDATGRVIENKTIPVANGINSYEMDISDYAKGIYMLVLRTDEGIKKGRIVVQ